MTAPKDQAVLETSIGALLDDGDFHELDRRPDVSTFSWELGDR